MDQADLAAEHTSGRNFKEIYLDGVTSSTLATRHRQRVRKTFRISVINT